MRAYSDFYLRIIVIRKTVIVDLLNSVMKKLVNCTNTYWRQKMLAYLDLALLRYREELNDKLKKLISNEAGNIITAD